MRFEGYDVTVHSGGKPLPEVQHLHSTFVVAGSGAVFEIKVHRLSSDVAHGLYVLVGAAAAFRACAVLRVGAHRTPRPAPRRPASRSTAGMWATASPCSAT